MRHRETDDEVPISVTVHAATRYRERARRACSARRLAREIIDGIREAFDLGLVFEVDRTTHVAPVAVPDGSPVCAVLDVKGPVEKPFAITILTVLSRDMAMWKFGHLPGLIASMRAARPLAVA